MSQLEKVEIMDLLINILKDHEKSLDTLITRMEYLMDERILTNFRKKSQTSSNIVVLKNWKHFCEISQSSEMVFYNISEQNFKIFSNKDYYIYEYYEKFPEFILEESKNEKNISELEGFKKLKFKLKMGLEIEIKLRPFENEFKFDFTFDEDYIRNWLSKKLNFPKNCIFYGHLKS